MCCTEEEFTINVIEGLSIANGALPSGHVGDQYGYQLSTSGGTASSWSVTGGSLPSGLTLDASGAITGMPTQTVSASFTVRASDGSRATTKQFTLYVVDPLVLTAPPAKAIKLGRSFVLTVTAKGGLAPYRWSATSLPAGVNLNPLTGQVGGRPQGLGVLGLTLTATDALGTHAERRSIRGGRRQALDPHHEPAERPERQALRGGAQDQRRRDARLAPAPRTVAQGLRFDAASGELRGVPSLPARKPLVKTKRLKTKKGVHVVTKRVPRTPLAHTYTLYLVATDTLGQRDSQKLRLTVPTLSSLAAARRDQT